MTKGISGYISHVNKSISTLPAYTTNATVIQLRQCFHLPSRNDVPRRPSPDQRPSLPRLLAFRLSVEDKDEDKDDGVEEDVKIHGR